MKRKSITLTICILAVLALASIGFASWIITNPNTQTQADGTIEVDDVTSKVFKIEYEWDTTSNGKIVFGKPSDYVDNDTDWLTNPAGATANLIAELTLTFQVEENVDLSAVLTETPIVINFQTLKSGVVMEDSVAADFYSNLTLPEPVLTFKSGETFDGVINASDLDENNKCVIKIEFDWGTATGGENPYEYYNGISFGTKVDVNGEQKAIEVVAEEYLQKLHDEFDGVTYRIVLEEQTA